MNLFAWCIKNEPDWRDMNPFDPYSSQTTLRQRIARWLLMTSVYRRRYIDHIQLLAYREHYPKFRAVAAKETREQLP